MARPSRQPRMFERGLLCLAIGAAVLLAPLFLGGSRFHDMVAGAAVVGWFALVLGAALVVVDLVKRGKQPRQR